jgi:hypothetical protein
VFSRKPPSGLPDGVGARVPYRADMDIQLPVIWKMQGTTSAGRLDLSRGRLVLTSRGRALDFPLGSVAASTIERGAARRLRGLPVLSLVLDTGETVSVASMGGPGSLQDLAAAVGRRQAPATGT